MDNKMKAGIAGLALVLVGLAVYFGGFVVQFSFWVALGAALTFGACYLAAELSPGTDGVDKTFESHIGNNNTWLYGLAAWTLVTLLCAVTFPGEAIMPHAAKSVAHEALTEEQQKKVVGAWDLFWCGDKCGSPTKTEDVFPKPKDSPRGWFFWYAFPLLFLATLIYIPIAFSDELVAGFTALVSAFKAKQHQPEPPKEGTGPKGPAA